MAHLVENATGTLCTGDECYTPLNSPQYFDFDPSSYTTTVAEGDVFDIAEEIVNSYVFINESFDALNVGVVDGEGEGFDTRWQAALFRLLDEPILTSEFDDIEDTGGARPEYVFDARTEGSERECIFDGFNTYESVGIVDRGERPY
eukprot:2096432-Rhodomonas_salina.1